MVRERCERAEPAGAIRVGSTQVQNATNGNCLTDNGSTLGQTPCGKRNVREITDQFTRYIITFPQCVTRLADELTAAKVGPGQMTDLADAMLVNNARVMGELERRGNKRRTDARYRVKITDAQIEPLPFSEAY